MLLSWQSFMVIDYYSLNVLLWHNYYNYVTHFLTITIFNGLRKGDSQFDCITSTIESTVFKGIKVFLGKNIIISTWRLFLRNKNTNR